VMILNIPTWLSFIKLLPSCKNDNSLAMPEISWYYVGMALTHPLALANVMAQIKSSHPIGDYS
ncbi:hypothetical protein, partial [Methylobacterium crusticola]|uniref:hypothetical protein n=1 Tax=Methylobacterium crusticola TaxID=1697972 RepID=UPI001EE35B1F